jgi:hypothetical protein
MYKCLDCGNEEKFYGVAKEQGNALIFQNVKREIEPVPVRQLVGASVGSTSLPAEPENTVRGDLWAIQNNGKSDEFTWAYLASEGSWKGFHQVRSCAVCYSTNIGAI